MDPHADPNKRCSPVGRTLDNALLNLGTKEAYKEGVDKLGFVSFCAYIDVSRRVLNLLLIEHRRLDRL